MGGNTSKPAAASAIQPSAQQKQGNATVQQEDYNSPLANKSLPKDLQSLVDKEEDTYWEQISEGRAPETTDSSIRYAAYATRVRTILLSAHRYVAYTSDIGESFRPIAHPYIVKGAYGVSWAYLVGDVAHEGYKAYLRQQEIINPGAALKNKAEAAADAVTSGVSSGVPSAAAVSRVAKEAGKEAKDAGQKVVDAVTVAPGSGTVPAIEDYRAVMAQRAVFQSIASMGLPAFTIHSIVRYSGRALKEAKNVKVRTWGPIGLGLAAVPFLPYMFDKPVEEAVEWTFHTAFRTIGGPEAVGHSRSTGREEKLDEQNKERKIAHKEL